MPLEIVTKEYHNRDLNRGSNPLLELDIPYAPVYQWGYGRVDASSPVAGLTTFNAASCTVVVIHSPDTRRTVLTHSPNFMIMDLTFIPIVEWVVSKDQDNYNPKSCIEAVILRGFQYNLPNTFGRHHPGWVHDFKNMLKHFDTHPIHVFDDKPLDVSSNGTVYVDKITGKITRVKLAKREPLFHVVNNSLNQVYTMQQRSRDYYVGTVIHKMLELDLEDWPTLHLQFNVDKYMAAVVMPDIARLAIRTKISNQKPNTDHPILVITNTDPLMSSLLGNIKAFGLPCERCDKPGDRKCLACLGAYYCSKQHQDEDWNAHRGFCESNKVK